MRHPALYCLWISILLACPSRLTLAAEPAEPAGATLPFEEIIAPSSRSHDQSRALMQSWVAAHPADARVPRGLIWIAQLHVADHQPARGREFFLRAYRDYPHTEWALHGVKGLADLDQAAHHYGDAIAKYDLLARSSDPFFRYVGTMAALQARGERLRVALALLIVAAFIALWAMRLWRLGSLRALWPPPTEVAYLMPLLLLMAAVAFGQPADEGRGVRMLAFGAMGMLWINGAYLRTRPPRGAWRLVNGLLGLAQAAALLYVVIMASGLWEKFHDTLVMGAE